MVLGILLNRLIIPVAGLLVYTQLNATELQSQCFGITSNGRLINGVQMPLLGNNFITYNTVASLLGRTYVHSEVKSIIIDSYKKLEYETPTKVFKYAEIGFANGGPFKPHKTHQNGLSVDFMVPVVDSKNQSVHLPTNLSNKFGYNIEFNQRGVFKDYRIDFEAMAAHIVELHKQARLKNQNLWRVIFDPKLQAFLFNTKYADYLKANINFSTRPAWVRHDEHYHVDFDIECKEL